MRMRAKVLTVATAMVTTFAILPTFGAAAAEPLDDGSYDVTVGEETWTVEVVDGLPQYEVVEGVEFVFDYDEETGRVLDEFDVVVDGASYEVEVDEGVTTVTEDEPAEDDAEGTDDGEESEGDEDDGDESDGEEEAEELEDDDDEEDELQSLEEDGEAADDAHGELVSTVAQCAPNGKVAREAGLPNHGFFVRAAAQGESVEFEVDDETMTADFSSAEGAEEFCTLAAELLEADEADTEATSDEVEADDDTEDEGDEDRGRGKGRSGEAPGRSGEAPGQAKKNG